MKLDQFRSYVAVSSVAGLCLLGVVAAQGQRPQGGGGQGGGGAMLVDFIAVTADGKPVTTLTPADVSIKVGGKARTVSELTLKQFAAPTGPAAAAAPAPEAAPAPGGTSAPFFTNEATAAAPAPVPAAAPAAGRRFLIVVDTESLQPGSEVGLKAALSSFLSQLTPADRVAFSTAPHDTAQIGFGTSIENVQKAVANIHGQKVNASSNTERDAIAYCRTSDTLNLLKGLLLGLPPSDAPTSVLVASASLSTTGSEKSTNGGTCEVRTDQYTQMSGVAAAARGNFYVIQADASAMGRDNGLENLAGQTNAGTVLRAGNDGFVARILSDASAYWVATLAPDPADKPGQPQKVEVKAAKPDVTIRVRPEVMMSRPAGAPAGAPAAGGGAKGGGAKTPKDMLASTDAFTDLQLRALAVVQRGAADKMNVLVFAEPVDPTVKIAAMRVGFFDASNKGPAVDAPQIATYPITTVLPVAAGQYRVRVAATDASGKAGAVDIKVDTTFATADPFRLSTLMLMAPTDKGGTPKVTFSSEPSIIAMFEMYGIMPANPEMIVGFEIADSDTGPAKKSYRPSASMPTQEPDKFQIIGEIPIADLPPGDYVIRGVVQLKDHPMGKTIKTFRKIAK